MKIGVWFDLRNPPGWRQDPARLYGSTLEMCEEAERLGADSVWFSEHHGFEDGYLPQPLTFAAAAAARAPAGSGSAPASSSRRCARPRSWPRRRRWSTSSAAAGSTSVWAPGTGCRSSSCSARTWPSVTARWTRQVGELRRLWGDGGLTPAPVQERAADLAGLPGPQGRPAGRPDGRGPADRGRQLLAALPGRPGRGRPRPGHRPDGRRHPGVRHRRPGTGLAARRPAHRLPAGQLPPVHGRGHRRPGAAPGRPGAAALPRPEAVPFPTSCSARPRRWPRRSGPTPGTPRWRRSGSGRPSAGMPEDLAARHVQTICTRLRPLLADPRVPRTPGRREPRGSAPWQNKER